MAGTFVLVQCCVCGAEIERRQAEVTRNAKIGRKTYCGLKCSGKVNNKHLLDHIVCGVVPAHLNPGNKRDHLSPFRYHLRNMKRHAHESGQACSVSLDDLKKQWDQQDGRCPYTGWEMENANTSGHRISRSPRKASVDRKDSKQGYVPGNIQFVSMMANFAKNDFTESELLSFCESVVKNRIG